jgi:hypothetical protein
VWQIKLRGLCGTEPPSLQFVGFFTTSEGKLLGHSTRQHHIQAETRDQPKSSYTVGPALP